MTRFSAIFLLAALPAAAAAHVTFAPGSFTPGQAYVGALRVSHGCEGAATTGLRLEIPAGVTTAKPQAKPGWTITTESVPLDKPYVNGRGKTVSDRVSAVTWSGGTLPDDEFDDFTVMLTMPDGAQPVYFAAVQTCGATQVEWKDVPAAGQSPHDLKSPAPVLTPQGASDGMDMPM